MQRVIFSVFTAKKLKKQEICSKFLHKTSFFKFAPECWSTVVKTCCFRPKVGHMADRPKEKLPPTSFRPNGQKAAERKKMKHF